jgi:uncharacterized protein (TIGR03435 family)
VPELPFIPPRIAKMGISGSKGLLFVTALGLSAVLAFAGRAQTSIIPGATPKAVLGADGKPLTFAVASVRRNLSGTGSCDPEHFFVTPDGFRMVNCPLDVVLFFAEVPSDGTTLGFSTKGRTIGAPEWMSSETYDINARLEEGDLPAWQNPATQKQMFHALLQALLAQRCKLLMHREMRERPVYDLVIAKNGPKLQKAASTSSVDIVAKHPDAGAVPGASGMFALGPNNSVALYGVSLRTLTTLLSNRAGRPVVDKTGLTGIYDIHLDPPQPLPDPVNTSDVGSSIFTTLQEQLGLKLEPAKEPVETLVIDSIERPSEN